MPTKVGSYRKLGVPTKVGTHVRQSRPFPGAAVRACALRPTHNRTDRHRGVPRGGRARPPPAGCLHRHVLRHGWSAARRCARRYPHTRRSAHVGSAAAPATPVAGTRCHGYPAAVWRLAKDPRPGLPPVPPVAHSPGRRRPVRPGGSVAAMTAAASPDRRRAGSRPRRCRCWPPARCPVSFRQARSG